MIMLKGKMSLFLLALSFYILNFSYGLVHKNINLIHDYNRLIVCSYTFVFPIINLYNYYIYNESLLQYYYLILYVQLAHYLIDFYLMVLSRNYTQISHHIIGFFLNYCGYLYRTNKSCNCIYSKD